MQEMPLIIFTLCEDLAVGSIVALVAFQLMGKEMESKVRFRIALIAFIVAAVGMCASMFHLGQPTRAFNVLAGLGTSWLSREVVFFGGFTLFALIYALMAKGDKPAAKAVGIIAAVLGVIALICTIMCYLLPGVPSWNSAVTPIMFILAAAALGYTFVKAMAPLGAGSGDAKAPGAKNWIIFVAALVIFAAWRVFYYSNIVLLVQSM